VSRSDTSVKIVVLIVVWSPNEKKIAKIVGARRVEPATGNPMPTNLALPTGVPTQS